MKRILIIAVGALVALAILLLAGGAGGYWLRDSLDDRGGFAYKARNKLIGYYDAVLRNGQSERTILETNRLTLDIETVFLPLEAADYAGGITTVDGEATLLVDREGDFFLIKGQEVTELGLEVPENGKPELRKQFDAGALGDAVRMDFNHFRYNDTLTFVEDGQRHLLLSFTRWYPEDLCYRSVLSRLSFPVDMAPADWKATPEDWIEVTRTEPCLPPFETGAAIQALEAGGRLVQLEGSKVLWSSGVYEWDDHHEGPDYSTSYAQSDSSDYGKILVVDILSGEMTAMAKGLRNPQGLTIDGEGRIWVTDHGMRGGDELNLVTPGANFGWPAVTYGTHYDGRPAVNAETHGNHEGYDRPAIAFVPSIAPGAALAIENFDPAWDGQVLVAGFNGNLYRVFHNEGRVYYYEPIFLGPRLRDLDRLNDGTIVIWTDNRRILYLRPSDFDVPGRIDEFLAGLDDETLREGVSETVEQCQQCHGFGPGATGSGPSLYEICGQRIAGGDWGNYSGALHGVGGKWTEERLTDFIVAPQDFAPDNTMPWGGLDDTAVAGATAALLCQVTSAGN